MQTGDAAKIDLKREAFLDSAYTIPKELGTSPLFIDDLGALRVDERFWIISWLFPRNSENEVFQKVLETLNWIHKELLDDRLQKTEKHLLWKGLEKPIDIAYLKGATVESSYLQSKNENSIVCQIKAIAEKIINFKTASIPK